MGVHRARHAAEPPRAPRRPRIAAMYPRTSSWPSAATSRRSTASPPSMGPHPRAVRRPSSTDYDGEAERRLARRGDGAELYARLRALPGFGDEKAKIFVALLGEALRRRPGGLGGSRRRLRRRRRRARSPTSTTPHRWQRSASWKKAQKAAGKDKQDRALEARGCGSTPRHRSRSSRCRRRQPDPHRPVGGEAAALRPGRRPRYAPGPARARRIAAAHGSSPSRVRATFRQPVGVGDKIDVTVDGVTLGRLTIEGGW